MAERIGDKVIFSLAEVTGSIQKALADRYQSAFWVKAEMNKLNLHPPSGHCYPSLVDKRDGKITAQMNALLWRDDYYRINRRFIDILMEPLKDGINILFLARVGFDPVHGLSLRIVDIDPAYSLGELEREKRETISKLKAAGIYDANRRLPMPLLPKRIAIISVETSKGYSDFMRIIGENQWGYRFFYMLFPALLQGDKAVTTIVAQLQRIRKVIRHFDAVAIIRGGGGEVGLTVYNDHVLAREIALFPIPVITGIGHSTNETVAELVAYRNAITPTDLADYLLQQFHNFAVPVNNAAELVLDRSGRILSDHRNRLVNAVRYFRSVTGTSLIRKEHELSTMLRTLEQRSFLLAGEQKLALERSLAALGDRVKQYLSREARETDHLEKSVLLLDPVNTLKRGYSITLKDGKLVSSTQDLRKGDLVKTILADGEVDSRVQ